MAFDPDEYLKQKAAEAPPANPQGFDPDAYLKSKSVVDDKPLHMSYRGLIPNAENPNTTPASAVLSKIDSYTGAPSRSAVVAAQQGNNPISAFAHQFGEDASKAPTGEDIAENALKPLGYGKENYPILNKIAGAGLGAAADWTLPLGLIKGGSIASETAAGQKALGAANNAADAIGVAKDAAIGTVKGAVTGISDLTSPKISPDFPKIAEIAKANNIDPNNLSLGASYGKDSTISRAERSMAEGAAGQEELQRHNAGTDQINDAIDKQLDKIGGPNASDPVQSGKALVDHWTAATQRMHDSVDLKYSSIQKYAPGLQMDSDAMENLNSTMNGIKKEAIGFMKRGSNIEKTQAQWALDTINSMEEQNGSYKQMNEFRQSLGDRMESMGNNVNVKNEILDKHLNKMYGAVSDALDSTIREHVNPDFADEIQKNNKTMTKFFNDADTVKDVASGQKAPEKILTSVLGDSDKVQALKDNLSPQEFKTVQGSMMNKLIVRDANGYVNTAASMKNINKNEGMLKVMFGAQDLKNNADMHNLNNLFTIADRHGSPMLTPSGPAMSFQNLPAAAASAGGNKVLLNNARQKAMMSLQQAPKGVPPK